MLSCALRQRLRICTAIRVLTSVYLPTDLRVSFNKSLGGQLLLAVVRAGHLDLGRFRTRSRWDAESEMCGDRLHDKTREDCVGLWLRDGDHGPDSKGSE